MTASLRGLVRRIRLWIEAGALRALMAALGLALLMTSAARAPDASIMQALSTEPALRLALPAAKQAHNEGGPTIELISDDAGPLVGDVADPGATASHGMPSPAPKPDAEMDEVNRYLWAVYERTTTKRDGSGDFSWKDVAAAARLGTTLGDYVIGGMDRDFREVLYRAGQAMDAAGIRWTILSAFRDDYRQGLATGYKARTGDSLHGGSFTTGGYGHGCAIDIIDADLKSRVLWTWLDANSAQLGLERPLPGIDPAHVQPRGPWHAAAAALRKERLKGSEGAATEPVDLSTTAPSEADMMCIGLHHRQYILAQANAATPPEHQTFKMAARAHGAGKLNGGDKPSSKVGGRLAARTPSSGELKSATRAGSRAADPEKPPHAKGAARSVARHALHANPRNAGTT
jgi:hypothetical protein